MAHCESSSKSYFFLIRNFFVVIGVGLAGKTLTYGGEKGSRVVVSDCTYHNK